MANFWFEERDTDRYFSYGEIVTRIPIKRKKSQKYSGEADYYESKKTDYNNKIERTREEWEAYNCSEEWDGQPIYRKGEITELQKVDELICQFMGDPAPHIDRDSEWYYVCHEIGFQTLYNKGGFWIGEQPDHLPYIHERVDQTIDRTIERFPKEAERFTEGYRARAHALIDWVFTKKWRFHATG